MNPAKPVVCRQPVKNLSTRPNAAGPRTHNSSKNNGEQIAKRRASQRIKGFAGDPQRRKGESERRNEKSLDLKDRQRRNNREGLLGMGEEQRRVADRVNWAGRRKISGGGTYISFWWENAWRGGW